MRLILKLSSPVTRLVWEFLKALDSIHPSDLESSAILSDLNPELEGELDNCKAGESFGSSVVGVVQLARLIQLGSSN